MATKPTKKHEKLKSCIVKINMSKIPFSALLNVWRLLKIGHETHEKTRKIKTMYSQNKYVKIPFGALLNVWRLLKIGHETHEKTRKNFLGGVTPQSIFF